MIECVPNFSEGRDPLVVSALAEAVRRGGATLLDSTSDPDHHRSVLTFAGEPKPVLESAFRAIETAAVRIDISRHRGVHPRTGAADVVPLVPLEGSSLAQCAELALELGHRVWRELRIPVYFYEAAALRPDRSRLENIRRHVNALNPDVGQGRHPTAGVCIIGARKVLIAWNINLRSTDLRVARDIAKTIRESSGGLPAVKAIGLELPTRGEVQVSMNLVDYEQTSPQKVFARVAALCAEREVDIAGCELIGLIPRAAVSRDMPWLNLTGDSILENRLELRG